MRLPFTGFLRDRAGMAAAEFALIAPALIFLFMGVVEMAMRFRASEEATRYVHQVADLVSRETALTTTTLGQIYTASIHIMKPLETTQRLDLDIASVGFEDPNQDDVPDPDLYWRRVAGDVVPLNLPDAAGLGDEGETVIRVGVRYDYTSPITSLFGGGDVSIVREAWARPRVTRLITMDGVADANGAMVTFGPAQSGSGGGGDGGGSGGSGNNGNGNGNGGGDGSNAGGTGGGSGGGTGGGSGGGSDGSTGSGQTTGGSSGGSGGTGGSDDSDDDDDAGDDDDDDDSGNGNSGNGNSGNGNGNSGNGNGNSGNGNSGNGNSGNGNGNSGNGNSGNGNGNSGNGNSGSGGGGQPWWCWFIRCR